MGKTKPSKQTETKLKRIRQLSDENTGMKFKWLMPHFNKESLIGCFNELDGSKAVGVDGQTKEEYRTNLEENIENLIEKMKMMAYRPAPVREVLIPKEGQQCKFRPLGISNFEDKLVQLMMSKILEAIFEPLFRDCSHGFRPNRSCHTAIKALNNHLHSNQCEVVIDVDLENFFGTIDHELLIKALRVKIKDNRFIRYIIRMLKAGVLSDGDLMKTDEGVPQGNVVSPILSNIFAHYAFDRWFEEVIQPKTRMPVKCIRYCDDIVICCRDRSDAKDILKALRDRLQRVSLKLNVAKTKLVDFSQKSFRKGQRQETFDFLGFSFYLTWSVGGNVTVKLKTSRKRLRSKLRKVKDWIKANRHKEKLKPLWITFRLKLRGHGRYYGVSHNVEGVRRFYQEAVRIFFKWINRRSQRKSLTWEQFNRFIQIYPAPRAKVYQSLF